MAFLSQKDIFKEIFSDWYYSGVAINYVVLLVTKWFCSECTGSKLDVKSFNMKMTCRRFKMYSFLCLSCQVEMCSLWFSCGKLSDCSRLTIDVNTDKHIMLEEKRTKQALC